MAGAWASCAAGRACARPWSGDREAIVNVIVWAIRRLRATQRRRPAAMEEIVAATADVDDEPTSSVKTGVGGAGFRGRLLGINPAVWAAGSELGACVRGRASSAAVRAAVECVCGVV